MRLAGLLAPIDRDEFLRTHWERSHLLIRGGEEKLAGMPSLADVDRIICENGAGRPFVTPYDREAIEQVLAKGATPIDLPPDPLSASEFFCERGKIVLNAAHRYSPALAEIRSQLARELGTAVQINAYLAAPHGRGAEPHYDPHDVMVLHLHGRKHWKLWKAPLPLPARLPLDRHGDALRLGIEEASRRPPIAELTMTPGDVLYFPRGTLHAVEPDSVTSLHLTIGIAPVRMGAAWASAMRRVLEAARAQPWARRQIAMPASSIARHLEEAQMESARAASLLLASKIVAGDARAAVIRERPEIGSTRGEWLRAMGAKR